MCRRLTIHLRMPAEQFPLTLASEESETTLGKMVLSKLRTPVDEEKRVKNHNISVQC